MATPPKSWFPWHRFQLAVGAWAKGALGFAPEGSEVVWADFNVQRPALPYLSLQVTAGPTRRAQDAELWPRLYPATVTVTILPAAVATTGDLTNLFVNGELFSYVAQLGDTVTDARDGLLVQIQASVQLMATAAPSGANAIVLTATEPGSLQVDAALACAAVTNTTALVAVTVGARDVRVRATAYGAPEPNAPGQVGVAEWIELLAEGTQDPDLRLELRRQGYVVSSVNVLQQRMTAPSGAEREPRAAADIVFACEIRRGRAVTTWLDEVMQAVVNP